MSILSYVQSISYFTPRSRLSNSYSYCVIDFGMIDQLVASRGRVFFGCYHSTFSGFIFRMRGYHDQKDKAEGWENGVLRNSYYYSGANEKLLYQQYYPLRAPYYSREFPTSWRDIDKGIEELSSLSK